MNSQPNPDWVSAPFECYGWLGGIEFYVGCREPDIPEDEVSFLWVKLPERQPMHFKNGKWVPWLNPPVGWDIMLPSENPWRYPDC